MFFTFSKMLYDIEDFISCNYEYKIELEQYIRYLQRICPTQEKLLCVYEYLITLPDSKLKLARLGYQPRKIGIYAHLFLINKSNNSIAYLILKNDTNNTYRLNIQSYMAL